MPPEKKPPAKKPSEKDKPEEKSSGKKYVPGWDPISDDEKPKKSRRRKKGGDTDELSEAGPSGHISLSPSIIIEAHQARSSTVVSSSSAQTNSKQGPSGPKSSSVCYPHRLTNIMLRMVEHRQGQCKLQRQLVLDKHYMLLTNLPQQIPIRFDKSRVRHTQVLLRLVSLQATLVRELGEFDYGQLDLISAALIMFCSSNKAVLAGKDPHTESPKGLGSESGNGKQEIVRLKGQPPRPASKLINSLLLASNHFEVSLRPKLMLWHYQITVRPEIKGPRLSQVIKLALLSETLQDLTHPVCTDFSAIMLSVAEIPPQCRNFKLQYKSEVETQVSKNAKEITITLDKIGIVDLSNPEAYLRQRDENSNGLPVEQALDIILGHHRKQSNEIAIVNKRKAFSLTSSADRQNLDAVLVALRGYFSSIRMSQSKILVNINVSHGAFYQTPRRLCDIIDWLRRNRGVNPSKVPGLLRGLRVRSTYIPRLWSFWGYPKSGDGRGYMLHPPIFTVPNAISHTPQQIHFFHENVEGSSQDRAQNLSDKDRESAKVGRLKAHDASCSCAGNWLTVAEYFKTGNLLCCCLIKCVLTD